MVSNVYIPSHQTIQIDKLKPLFVSTQNIIAGYLNVKSNLWSSPTRDHRGVMIETLPDECDHSVTNTCKAAF